jgi:iron complex outermembrane receptor protein
MGKLLRATAPVAIAAWSGIACAQTPAPNQSVTAPGPGQGSAAPSGSPQGRATPPSNRLEEVVVTAQRRSENLQKAAVAVDVVGGSQLVRNNITAPTDLNLLVPALNATEGGFFLRGIGNFTPTPYADPALAFNYDGIYIGRPASTNGYFFDLARVEVLKGPQGTLYGRNATGGAINVIPEKPRPGVTSAYLTVSAGNYGAYNVEGAVNAALDDKTAVRVSGSFVEHIGYYNDGTSDEGNHAARIQVLRNVTPDLTIRLAGDWENLTGQGAGAQYVGAYQLNPITKQYALRSAGVDDSEGLFDARSQAFRTTVPAGPAGRDLAPIADYPFQNVVDFGTNADIAYDTPYGKLVIDPSYRHNSNTNRTAVPGFTADLTERDEQYSVETRFTGNRIGIFDYTLGGLYYHETNDGHYSINQQALAIFQDFDQEAASYAAFGRLTAHLSDSLRLVGGLRYTADDKSFDGTSADLTIVCIHFTPAGPVCPAAPLFSLVPTLAQVSLPVPTKIGGIAPIIGAHGFTDAIVVRGGNSSDTSLSTDKVTYRGAVEYDLAPQSLLYASVETGYRTGGFSLAVGYETYQPETITAYTVGSKNRFLDNRLQLNLEAFRWDYRNQQVNHLGVDLAGQQGQFTQNIGQATNQGLEADTRFLLTPNTALNADLQYLDAVYNSFSYQAPIGDGPVLTSCAQSVTSTTLRTVDCAGRPTFNSPKFTLDLGVEQTVEFGAYRLVGSVDTQYKSSRYIGFEYLDAERQGSTWQTNAELAFSPDVGWWSLQAYVHNLENDRFKVNANLFTLANVLTQTTAAPLTFGARVTVRY